jgi:Transcriptional regulator
MNTTPTTSKGEQAKSQLIAAAIAQFGEYGLHATTRDIAALAGQNIAAIPYYFGSKEDLYLACAQWIANFMGSNFRALAETGEQLLNEPELNRAAIRELILQASRQMILLLTQDETVNLSKFISREQLSPSPAYQLIHDQVIAPLHAHLTRLVAAYTGRDPTETAPFCTLTPCSVRSSPSASDVKLFCCAPAGLSLMRKKRSAFSR